MPNLAEIILILMLTCWLSASVWGQVSPRLRHRIPIFQFLFPLPFWQLFSGNIPALGVYVIELKKSGQKKIENLFPSPPPSLLNLLWFARAAPSNQVLAELHRVHSAGLISSQNVKGCLSLELLRQHFLQEKYAAHRKRQIVISVEHPSKSNHRILHVIPPQY